MLQNLKRIILCVSLVTLTNCVTNSKYDSNQKVGSSINSESFPESHNEKLMPSEKTDRKIHAALSEDQKMDPFYLRTQADYHYSLGEAYSLDGESTKAIEAFNHVLVYDSDSESVRIRLAKEYLKLGQINQSIEQVQMILKKNDRNTEARILLGGLYTSIRSYQKAIEQYELVLKDHPNQADVSIYLAAVYSELKEYDKSIQLFEKILHKGNYANQHLIYYYIGRIREEQAGEKNLKLIKKAEDAYIKSNELKPDFVDSLVALGALYKRQSQEEKAVKLYENYQKSHGPNLKVAEILSQYYLEKQRFDEAYEQLELLESQNDDPLSIKVRLALILIEKKMFDRAISKLEEILRLAPESDKIRFYLAAVYEEIKKDDLAVLHYKKIPVSSSFYGESVVHGSYLLKNLGKLEEAVELAKEGFEKKKDYPQLFAMYATLLDEKKDYKKAIEVLEEGISKFKDNAQLHFYYGTIYDRLGNKNKVIDIMKKVVDLDPNHAQGLNYLAFTWAEMNTNLDDAEKYSRRATQLEPKDGYILDTLGWVLYKKGNKSESLKILELAFHYQPTVGIIAEHLGDVYKDFSMIEKAKKMYEKARSFESDENKIKELKDKILAIDKQLIPGRMPANVDTK